MKRLALFTLLALTICGAAEGGITQPLPLHYARLTAQRLARKDVREGWATSIGRPTCQRGRSPDRARCRIWENGTQDTYQYGATMGPDGKIHGKKVRRLHMQFYMRRMGQCVNAYDWNDEQTIHCALRIAS